MLEFLDPHFHILEDWNGLKEKVLMESSYIYGICEEFDLTCKKLVRYWVGKQLHDHRLVSYFPSWTDGATIGFLHAISPVSVSYNDIVGYICRFPSRIECLMQLLCPTTARIAEVVPKYTRYWKDFIQARHGKAESCR